MAFQPTRVESRLEELGESLLLGILIVAGVVIIAMGLRLGLVVASVVPLVAMASLGVFAFLYIFLRPALDTGDSTA